MKDQETGQVTRLHSRKESVALGCPSASSRTERRKIEKRADFVQFCTVPPRSALPVKFFEETVNDSKTLPPHFRKTVKFGKQTVNFCRFLLSPFCFSLLLPGARRNMVTNGAKKGQKGPNRATDGVPSSSRPAKFKFRCDLVLSGGIWCTALPPAQQTPALPIAISTLARTEHPKTQKRADFVQFSMGSGLWSFTKAFPPICYNIIPQAASSSKTERVFSFVQFCTVFSPLAHSVKRSQKAVGVSKTLPSHSRKTVKYGQETVNFSGARAPIQIAPKCTMVHFEINGMNIATCL